MKASGKKTYKKEDIEKSLIAHPRFIELRGVYVLSKSAVPLGPPEDGVKFSCTEEEFKTFIDGVMEAILSISLFNVMDAPKAWAPLPGVDKGALFQKYHSAPETIKVDPNIVVIRKTADEGKNIYWETPTGRIGSGGHPVT